MSSLSLAGGAAEISVLLLFGLGAVVGLLGGFFGVGGGWIVTPALNVFGMPMPFAVGTGFGYMTGMSSISAWKHRKRGKTEPRLALVIGLAMIGGVQLGEKAMMALDAHGDADPVVRIIYIVSLSLLGIYMFIDALRDPRVRKPTEDQPLSAHREAPLQKFLLPPVIHLPNSDIRVSIWPLLVIGLLVGFLSGILGVGGGFVLMPVMVYLIGVRTIGAVGTSLMCLVLASPFGLLAYALEGWVEFLAAGVMIAGAAVGAPIGVRASHSVTGPRVRLLYAVMIVLGGASVLLKELGSRLGAPGFDMASRVLILSAAGSMALVVVALMLVATAKAKETPEPDAGPTEPPP